MLQSGLGIVDGFHLLDFRVTSFFNLIVLVNNHGFVYKYCIFVVSRDWRLGHFNLSLLEIDDYLEVILHFFQSLAELLGPVRGSSFLLLQRFCFSL